jgi:hypothetical protein
MSNEGKKKTLLSTPLPLNNKKNKKIKNQGAPFPPSHNEFVKKITTGEPLPTFSTMKKTFPKKPNVPLSPLLLPPFHISRGKKNINLHPHSPQQ